MKKLLLTSIALLLFTSVRATDCDIDISVIEPIEGKSVPASVDAQLTSKLVNLLSRTGISGTSDNSRFFLTGRFDDSHTNSSGGAAKREVVVTTLTLYIGDADDRKIFATKSFKLRGVGMSESQAYIKAIESINADRKDIVSFIEEGKDRIVEYFDKNYQQILVKARTAMNSRRYDEALYYAMSIPECCQGFEEAQSLALEIYDHNVDYVGQYLLARAKSAYGADPGPNGARKALNLLALIDPNAVCYDEALKYADQIAAEVKDKRTFDEVQKYKDRLELAHKVIDNRTELEKARIEGARAVGSAWAKSQPSTRIYYNWY